MAVHIPDFVRVTIDGTDRTAYVVSYARHSTLCAFSDTFTLELSFEIPVTPDPYDSIVINELYDGENEKILGGFIIDIIQNFDNGNYIINGQDKTLLLDDFFIHTQPIANNENVAFWIDFYAGLVGLSVQYDSSVTQFIVEEGTPMGLLTPSDGLALLERLAAVYIKYDAVIDKLRVFRINTSEPVIQITNSETTKFDRERSTDKTRNVVKVYGAQRFNIFSGTTTQVTAKAITNLDELVVDKTAVVANPHIRRVSIAQLVATRILQIIDDVDDVLHIETAGFYPQVEVGEYMGLNIGTLGITYSADREVTSIQTTVDANGVATIFTVGEKCPRVSIMPPTTAVYATARNGGVLVSWDAGDGFEAFNRGIVSQVSEVGSGINGTSIAANKFGQLMAIVDNTLYGRVGKYGRWTDLSTFLPDPSEDEGEHQFGVTDLSLEKVEKESNAWGKFHFLAKVTSSGGIVPPGQERWWVYWTPDFGTTWDSMQLYAPASGAMIGPSGLPAGLTNGIGITHLEMQTAAALSGTLVFNIDAKDIEGGTAGDVTVLVQGEPKFFIPEDTVQGETFYQGQVHVSETPGSVGKSFISGSTWYMNNYDQGNFATENKTLGTTFFVEGNAFNIAGPVSIDSALFSVPHNREIAYYVTIGGNVHGYHIGRTIGNYTSHPSPPPTFTDIPAWEYLSSASVIHAGAAAVHGFFLFYDYSSLQGSSTKVRWAVITATVGPGSGGGDSYASNSTLDINVMFFEDDIAVDESTSCVVKNEVLKIGITPGSFPGSPLTYDGEGLFGYTARPSTGSPVPRSSQWGGGVGETAKGGASNGSMTKSKTGGNFGYAVYKTDDGGLWHGDDRDDGWPAIKHPRDIEEHLNIGLFVIKLDLTNQTIDSVNGHSIDLSAFHDNPPMDDTDIDDYALNAVIFRLKMQTPTLFQVRHDWDGHGEDYDFWMSYPGFTVLEVDKDPKYTPGFAFLPKGVLKVPFYAGTMTSEVHNDRTITGAPPHDEYTGTTSFFRRTNTQPWELSSPPPKSPSGQVVIVRQHPSFGICINEQRAMQSGRGASFDDNITRWDYDFMWKAQRASSSTYIVQGSANTYLNPYPIIPVVVGRTNVSQGRGKPWSWDFRTASGSFGLEDGGPSGTWNFLD